MHPLTAISKKNASSTWSIRPPPSFQRQPGSACPVRLAVTGCSEECTLSGLQKPPRERLDTSYHPKGHVIFPMLNETCTAGPEDVAKTKARQGQTRQGQRRIAKGNERLPDNQARRRSRKEKYPSGAKRNWTERDQENRPTSPKPDNFRRKQPTSGQPGKNQRKPDPHMRKNRPENKKTKKQRQLKQVPTRNPYRRETGKGGNVDSTPRYHSLLEDEPLRASFWRQFQNFHVLHILPK